MTPEEASQKLKRVLAYRNTPECRAAEAVASPGSCYVVRTIGRLTFVEVHELDRHRYATLCGIADGIVTGDDAEGNPGGICYRCGRVRMALAAAVIEQQGLVFGGYMHP